MSTKALSTTEMRPSLFEDLFKPWNEWFDGGGLMEKMKTIPAVNVVENNDHYMVSLAAPGLQKDDFQIDVDGHMLTITSQKEEKQEQKDKNFTRKEYNYSSFSRSFTLPEDVKQEAIEASYDKGLLNIRLPRKENMKKTSGSHKIVVK